MKRGLKKAIRAAVYMVLGVVALLVARSTWVLAAALWFGQLETLGWADQFFGVVGACLVSMPPLMAVGWVIAWAFDWL